jgi:hypothetical protein
MLSEIVSAQQEKLLSDQSNRQKVTLDAQQAMAVEQIGSLLKQTRDFLHITSEEVTALSKIPPSFVTNSQYYGWYKRSNAYKAAQITALFFECEGFDTKFSRHSIYEDIYSEVKTKYLDITITPR